MAAGIVERAAAAAGPVCGLHRHDAEGLVLPWLCGRRPRHPGRCGQWVADTVPVCPCGRTESEHTRGWQTFNPDCTAWPPED